MRKPVSLPAVLLLCMGLLILLQAKQGNAQVVQALETTQLLPPGLEGFSVDPPMVVVEETRNEEYISVSRMSYRPHTGESLTLTFKDYSVNPQSYQKQLARLKKLKKDSGNTSVSRYKGNLMNRERRENYIEKGIYLGQNKAVEVVHEGALSDTTLSTILLNRLDLDRIKAKL